jgi:hypothetical protein
MTVWWEAWMVGVVGVLVGGRRRHNGFFLLRNEPGASTGRDMDELRWNGFVGLFVASISFSFPFKSSINGEFLGYIDPGMGFCAVSSPHEDRVQRLFRLNLFCSVEI